MTFQQLYYTNCERGLSGYVGYQFNAITPRTSADTLRDVEALTGYEAPQSLAYSSEPADLAKCPVNLCYSPGPITIVASVRYIGKDSSRRFGNYFAHALATTAPDADLVGTLPIELWRAPFWVAEQAPSPDLPGLDGPLALGPLRREQVSAFIARHSRADQLAALISATALAQAGADRPVLVVEETADDVAMWFAAISYLLPPRLVSGISFATYVSRPSRSRLQLLGTLSETNLDLGADAPENFWLFDFAGERFAAVPVHPLAALTSALGAIAAAALWDWAQSLADGTEHSIDDWYPVTAAAAALGQIPLTGAQTAVAIRWLGSASHLPEATQSEVAWVLHDQPGYQQAADVHKILADVARRARDQPLLVQVSCELLEAQMIEVLTGLDVHPPEPVTDPAVRDRTSARCQELLQQCDTGGRALALLSWAVHAQLQLNPQIVIECTQRLVGPWLARASASQPADEALRLRAHGIASRLPDFRSGLASWLTELPQVSPASVQAVMTGLIGEMLVERDLRGHPWLTEMYLVSRALRNRERRVDVLTALARRRGDQPVDAGLLTMIWQSGGWTRPEALEILRNFDPAQLRAAEVLNWFYQATQRRLQPADIKSHIELCYQLLSSPLGRRLTVGQVDCLQAMIDLDRIAGRATALADLEPLLGPGPGFDAAPMRTLLRIRVVGALTRVQATPDALLLVLPKLPGYAVDSYFAQVRRMLTETSAIGAAHIAALAILVMRERDKRRAEQAEELVRYAIEHWHRRELEFVAKLIDTVNPELAAELRAEIAQVRARPAVRVAKQISGFVSTVAKSRPAQAGDATRADSGKDREG